MECSKAGKIFCLGWCKTGTTSIEHGLIELNFKGPKSIGQPALECIENENYEAIHNMIEPYDYFCDYPWFYKDLYKYLDRRYPDSKFILPVRETKSWHKSTKAWFSDDGSKGRKNRYESPILKSIYGDLEKCVERYERHNDEVQEHFKNRNQDFLLFSPTTGNETWQKFCDFLNVPSPYPDDVNKKFVHKNRQNYTSDKGAEISKTLEQTN